MSTDHDEIEAIRARWAAATPGPWRWEGNLLTHRIRLVAPRSLVMGFERWGMGRAAPVFEVPGGALKAPREIAVRNPKYQNDIQYLQHPSAIAIAAAPTDIRALFRVIDAQAAELQRMRRNAEAAELQRMRRTWHDSHDCAGGGACRCGGAGGDFTCTVCKGTGGAIAGAK